MQLVCLKHDSPPDNSKRRKKTHKNRIQMHRQSWNDMDFRVSQSLYEVHQCNHLRKTIFICALYTQKTKSAVRTTKLEKITVLSECLHVKFNHTTTLRKSLWIAHQLRHLSMRAQVPTHLTKVLHNLL